jgi:hypothetical protein
MSLLKYQRVKWWEQGSSGHFWPTSGKNFPAPLRKRDS